MNSTRKRHIEAERLQGPRFFWWNSRWPKEEANQKIGKPLDNMRNPDGSGRAAEMEKFYTWFSLKNPSSDDREPYKQ